MFLQGTASVYSKKVELLWQTVLKMLDTLASKRAIEEAEASGEGEEDGSEPVCQTGAPQAEPQGSSGR